MLSYIVEGFDVSSLFRHFKGNFKGRAYDSVRTSKTVLSQFE